MIDANEHPRSEESTSNAAQATNSRSSNGSAPAPKGRSHPTVISGRVSHSTKGRAKDIARTRGVSLCQFVREAVQRAVRTHEKSPDAV